MGLTYTATAVTTPPVSSSLMFSFFRWRTELVQCYRFSDASEYSMDSPMRDSNLLTPSATPTAANNSPEETFKDTGLCTGCHLEGPLRTDGRAQNLTCKQCELTNMTPISFTAVPADDTISGSFFSHWKMNVSPCNSSRLCDNNDSPTQQV